MKLAAPDLNQKYIPLADSLSSSNYKCYFSTFLRNLFAILQRILRFSAKFSDSYYRYVNRRVIAYYLHVAFRGIFMKLVTKLLLATAISTSIGVAAGAQTFGEIRGGYSFADPMQEWQLFQLGFFDSTPSGPGAGISASLMTGFDAGPVDVALNIGGFSLDPKSNGDALNNASLASSGRYLDLMVGTPLTFGGVDGRILGGVRYAEVDNYVLAGTRGIENNFSGYGPTVRYDGSIPMSGNSIAVSFGASYLFGDIATFVDPNAPGWICIDCSDTQSDALVVEAAIGYEVPASFGSYVFGYQVAWWDGVNVAVQDSTDQGGNAGTSGFLMHGVYVGLRF